MTPFLLLAMLSGLLLAVGDDAEDEVTSDDPPLPEDPDEPDVIPDTGASFVQTTEGVEIELGADETGSLAVLYHGETEEGYDFEEVYEARFYLVPEGVDWSDASYETQFDVPGEGTSFYDLEDFEAFHGLDLLGVVDLDDPLIDPNAPNQGVGDIVANAPVEGYFLIADTDSGDLVSFLPEDFVPTRNGVAETTVTQDTTGGAGDDWLNASADGIIVNGAAGDDILTTSHADVTLDGGSGDDTVEAFTGTDVVILGGAGDDHIIGGSATVDGGDGNDRIGVTSGLIEGAGGNDRLTVSGDGPGLVYGQTGDDTLNFSGAESRGFGGAGNDSLVMYNGATGYGGNGDDRLQVNSGTTGFGDAGDDLFAVWNLLGNADGAATVTGGEGADTIDVRPLNAGGGEGDEIHLHMTDFDPAEDILQVGVFQTQSTSVVDIEIIESPDGSGTEVRVEYAPRLDTEPGITVIRLEGTTGLSEDQIVVVS